MIAHFGSEYLHRTPTEAEQKRILKVNEKSGFPGLFASWDCSHFKWDKCPISLDGQFKGRHEGKTIVLEAVVDCFLRIWYINYGSPGSLNDLNVLQRSSIVASL